MTFPLAVTLKRLATAFLVFLRAMGLGIGKLGRVEVSYYGLGVVKSYFLEFKDSSFSFRVVSSVSFNSSACSSWMYFRVRFC